MAFTPRTEVYADSSAATTLNCAVPTGTATHDILFAWIGLNNSSSYVVNSVHANWTLIGNYTTNADKYYLYYRVVQDGDPTAYDWGFSGSTKARVVTACYTESAADYDYTDPIDVYSNTAYRTTDVNVRAATMNVSAANSPLLFFGAEYYTTASVNFSKPTIPTTGWVEDDDTGNTGSDFYLEICSYIWSGSGATGDMTATATSLATKHAFAVALNPVTGSAPTVTTQAVSDILTQTATGNGNVTADGGNTILERGICWDTATGPTTADYKASTSGTTGAYTVPMTGLVSNTHYYVRAYAINVAGTSYGSEVEFDTDFGFNDARQDIIDGLVSNGSETHGWDNDVIAALAVTDVIRTSDTVVTITLPYTPTYAITANETVTVTVPASAVAGATQIVATPTFTISDYVPPPTSLINSSIDVTGVAAGNRWCSTADPEIFEDDTFTGSHTSGHAIRITSPGTYAFSGNTLTGFGPAAFGFHTQTDVDATNDEIDHTAHGYNDGDPVYYQDQGGSDTIGLTDGNLYYVNAVTADSLAFYDTYANAIAGGATGKQGLTDGAAGQTHYLYSAGAAIYNDSAGSITLNISGGGNSPSYRDANGCSTTVNLAINLDIRIVDADGNTLTGENCEVTVVRVSDETVLFHEDDITDGTTTYSFTSGAGTAVYINVLNVAGYQNKTAYLDLPEADTETVIQLDEDRFYANPT